MRNTIKSLLFYNNSKSKRNRRIETRHLN